MNNLEKIKKWANENGYRQELEFGRYKFVKDYELETCLGVVYMVIYVDFCNKTIENEIDLRSSTKYNKKDQLEELFIPFNRVKRDEKLLREYLKDDR